MSKKGEEIKWYEGPLTFLIETISGAAIFVFIAGAALGINLLVQYFESKGIDSIMVTGLITAEYMIFAADLIMLARFLFRSVERNWKKF